MKEYLKMSDVFDGLISVSGETIDNFTYYGICGSNPSYYAKFDVNGKAAKYTAHAINSHDELASKLDVAESTIYEVERVLSEMQRNGAFGLDDVIAEVECCIKRISE